MNEQQRGYQRAKPAQQRGYQHIMNEQEQPIHSAEDAHQQISHQILSRATLGVKMIMSYAHHNYPEYMQPMRDEIEKADAHDPSDYKKYDAHRLTTLVFNEIQRAIVESHLDNTKFPPPDQIFEAARIRLEDIRQGLDEVEDPDVLHNNIIRRLVAVMITGPLQRAWETESFNWKTIMEEPHDQKRLQWLFARELTRLRESNEDPEDYSVKALADNIRHAFLAGEEVTSKDERNACALFFPHHNFPEKPAFLQEV